MRDEIVRRIWGVNGLQRWGVPTSLYAKELDVDAGNLRLLIHAQTPSMQALSHLETFRDTQAKIS